MSDDVVICNKAIMEKMIGAINDLSSAVQDIENMIVALKEISSKTDLLALNASIEAARAGQAGKGFAVVADEVGRLAEKSQVSIEGVDKSCDQLKRCLKRVGELATECSTKKVA